MENLATTGRWSPDDEYVVESADGVSLWTRAEGDGVLAMLLSVGGPRCPDYLAPLSALLAGKDCRVIRWEQRGVGRSGGDPEGPFTIAQCLTDMEAIREHYGCERWVVAGHSWGADLSLIYALNHPERCAGLLCLAGGRLSNDREWYAAYARGVEEGREVPLQTDPPTNIAVNRQLSADFKRYLQRPTLFREVAALQVPALFLYGDADIRPSWAVAQIATLLPQAQFTLIPNADHYLYLSHPDQVQSQSEAFLSTLKWDIECQRS